MSRKLRSRFEPGTPRWVGRRAPWPAMGSKEDDFDRPGIAIVNSSSKPPVGFQHPDAAEAAGRGAIAAARGGDTISIDLNAYVMTLEISEGELAGRAASLPPRPATIEKGWAVPCRQLVQPLSKDAALGAYQWE